MKKPLSSTHPHVHERRPYKTSSTPRAEKRFPILYVRTSSRQQGKVGERNRRGLLCASFILSLFLCVSSWDEVSCLYSPALRIFKEERERERERPQTHVGWEGRRKIHPTLEDDDLAAERMEEEEREQEHARTEKEKERKKERVGAKFLLKRKRKGRRKTAIRFLPSFLFPSFLPSSSPCRRFQRRTQGPPSTASSSSSSAFGGGRRGREGPWHQTLFLLLLLLVEKEVL